MLPRTAEDIAKELMEQAREDIALHSSSSVPNLVPGLAPALRPTPCPRTPGTPTRAPTLRRPCTRPRAYQDHGCGRQRLQLVPAEKAVASAKQVASDIKDETSRSHRHEVQGCRVRRCQAVRIHEGTGCPREEDVGEGGACGGICAPRGARRHGAGPRARPCAGPRPGPAPTRAEPRRIRAFL